ncbi:MAG TPA: serine/threonine protein kinase, partial [Streptomyces sp.]|nr:serine/threonine protein kinase [Streptomyces sp.]
GYGRGPTPPYGPAPARFAPPAPERRRRTGSTLLLAGVALLVAVGAGCGVYAFMQGGSGGSTASGTGTVPPSAAGASTGGTHTDGKGSGGAGADGAVPAGFLGAWSGTVEGGGGPSTRRLVVQQGEVGDTVLSLTAEGPLGTGGSYRCVFQADLDGEPSSGGPVRIGSSRVTEGEPMSSCAPGEPTVLTLLPDGTLRREGTVTGKSLTYTKTG